MSSSFLKTSNVKYWNVAVSAISILIILGCTRKQISTTDKAGIPGTTKDYLGKQGVGIITNPYILNFPASTDPYRKASTIYNLRGKAKKVTNIIPNYNPANYSNEVHAVLSQLPYMELAILSSFSKSSANGQLRFDVFQLQAVYGNVVCGAVSTVVVSDSIGNIITKFTNIDVNIVDIGTTPDGECMFVSYGYNSEAFNNIIPGYRIFDLHHKKVLADEKMANSDGAVCYLNGNLICTDFSYVKDNIRMNRIVVTDVVDKTRYMLDVSNSDRFIIEKTKDDELLKISKDDNSTVKFEKITIEKK